MTPPSDLRRILLEALIIVLVGALLGLTFNYRLVLDLFSPVRTSPPAAEKASPETAFPTPVTLEDVRDLLERDALPVDARAEELYSEGHLPGARSVPIGSPEALEAFVAEVPRDRILIVYCSGYGCPDSFDLGLNLVDQGYRSVRVYEGGFPEWRDAGLPVEGGP